MLAKRKGISTFIATLLLMVLAVSAGVVIYAYTMGYLGGFGGTEQLGAMSIDEYSGNTTVVAAYVRNIGKTTVNITRAYVDGDLAYVYNTTQWTTASDGNNWVEIEENNVEAVYIALEDQDDVGDITTYYDSGHTYEVKLIAEDNTQVSFTVKID